MDAENLRGIAEKFSVKGSFLSAQPVTSGHIHDTWLSSFKENGNVRRYIHQRINHYVFKSPDKVQENIGRISSHIKNLSQKAGRNPERESLTIVPTGSGESFYLSPDGDYWRTFVYVEGARTYEKAESPDLIHKASAAFGRFQMQLDSLSGGKLHETIPDFHYTPKRFEFFLDVLKRDPHKRAAQVREEVDFILKRGDETAVVVNLMKQGKLPERVTHNDTKLNNVLFDEKSGEAICVIDLDTCMPGSALYDFGDSVRIAASTAAEDEPDLSLVGLNLELFEALTAGYLESTREMLTEMELKLLAFSARLITLEQGIRFLSDHLNGDVYYKISRENHNLDRARTQLKMVKEMEERADEMETIVAKYL